ncbi:zinc finger BED domain-containing protein 5-like [Littorina saxatilis]|uniref:zinc finger BED domain-containing protein 5-like n=1 Tax=Littorina saxatilis TaxID=31220 RepID=UPI0038B43850
MFHLLIVFLWFMLLLAGENIFKLVDSEFKAQQIPWENCISFGCDNANVMTGCHKGVIAFVRTKQPNVHMAGCCLHLVHIAAKKGAALLPPVEDILVDIFYYFNKSVNRQTELKGLQELYDVEQRKMLKHGCTRWLSIGRCLERLLKNWEPLIHFFRDEKAKTKGIGSHATSKAEGIHLFLRSPTNKLFCHFLSHTLKVYDQVLVQLQAEKPMVHSLRANLVRLVEDLFSRFMEPGAVFGVDIGKVCTSTYLL